ncbi:hypothetical protein [Neisseria sp. 74A18]|uniref:hypothetical protein n=1 Tax=Neisseria sp. 74A18 TaxID=1696094 RepID=UPI0006CAE206|nr:hypothetical protein [Neisseria sp. 74A18]KPN73638.1 hypothetical protein AKG43_07045 [Neisseria sp. 74A18]
MPIFQCEADMQDWLLKEIEKNNGDINSIISNYEEFCNLYQNTTLKSKVLNSFNNSIKSLFETEILSDNKNISFVDSDILKPDFVLFSYSTESLVLIELKNSSNATREAGTELGAYSYELSSYFPNIPKLDFVYVIISNNFPTLLLHHVRNMIFIQKLNVLCLRPIRVGGEIKLEILEYTNILDMEIFPDRIHRNRRIPASSLQSFQICVYDDELQKGSNDFTRLDKYINILKTALNNMAIMGNNLNSNGFAILWKDNYESLAPYSVSVIYLPSYEQMRLQDEKNVEIFRNLNKLFDEYTPVFGNSIKYIAKEVKTMMRFEENCSVDYEGFMDFRTWLKTNPFRCCYLSFVSWGELFRDYHMQIFHEISNENEEYFNGDHADVAYKFIDYCIDIDS